MAQNGQVIQCGWDDSQLLNNESRSEDCFNVDEVFETCSLLYIPVNLHYFTTDDCNGDVYYRDVTPNDEFIHQNEVYPLAEQLIDDANYKLANNEHQWQSSNPNPNGHCIPLRLVLSGVYIHCSSADQYNGGLSTPTLQTNYAVNPGSEVNVYIAEYVGNGTGIGYHNGAYASIDWVIPGNLVHELGHVFNLKHTFDPIDDGCDDTATFLFDWDKNCNGILDDNFNSQLDEVNLQCWSHIEPNQNSDANGNGTQDCQEVAPCAPYPCCDWANVNNNIMGYNTYQSALTDCQIKRMLSDLADETVHCNYFTFGDCPIPHSFITQTPSDAVNTERCTECLILEASYNEDEYYFEIYELKSQSEILVYSSGWQQGKAKNYCFSTVIGTNYLKPNTNYKSVLKVKNTCYEDEAEYFFTTPGTNCSIDGNPPSTSVLKIAPNPATGITSLEFQADDGEGFVIMLSNPINGNLSVVNSNYTATDGSNNVEFNASSLAPGTYTITVLSAHRLFLGNLVKL